MNEIIVKVRQTVTGQRLVTVPKDCDLETGENIVLVRLKEYMKLVGKK